MSESFILAFQVYGLAILISMLVAVMIRVVVASLSVAKRRPAAVAPRAEAQVDIAGDHIAAIAAAIYAVLGAHRIVHIEDRGRGFAWTAEGRAAHHASHTISKHTKP
jgi:hypothetical protein